MAKKLTKDALMEDMKNDITICFNRLAELVVSDLSTSTEQGGYSPTLTGFYASSWKASKTPIAYNDIVYNHQPWADKRDEYEATKKRPKWTIDRRHNIPKFTIRDTMYIANSVSYTSSAFRTSRVPEYAAFGVNKAIEEAYSHKTILSYKANLPK